MCEQCNAIVTSIILLLLKRSMELLANGRNVMSTNLVDIKCLSNVRAEKWQRPPSSPDELGLSQNAPHTL